MGIFALIGRMVGPKKSRAAAAGCCVQAAGQNGDAAASRSAPACGCGGETAAVDRCSRTPCRNPDGTFPAGSTLLQTAEGREYRVRGIATDDEELDAFLFTLGCFAGASVTVVACHRGGCVVALRDGRYNLDDRLAGAILI